MDSHARTPRRPAPAHRVNPHKRWLSHTCPYIRQEAVAHIVGLIVVTMLISPFVLGSRLQAGVTPRPEDQPLTDRLPGATDERRRSVAVRESSRRQRLRPHQLRGRTEQAPATEEQ
ncbi:DUF6479 family protein [Streptomyces sp. NPDC048330]|uniref:DUF6479 family protein n=1 Tax=Streptomyces sp. NPDC048330 TaxID=3365533 RepID=UPI00371C234D